MCAPVEFVERHLRTLGVSQEHREEQDPERSEPQTQPPRCLQLPPHPKTGNHQQHRGDRRRVHTDGPQLYAFELIRVSDLRVEHSQEVGAPEWLPLDDELFRTWYVGYAAGRNRIASVDNQPVLRFIRREAAGEIQIVKNSFSLHPRTGASREDMRVSDLFLHLKLIHAPLIEAADALPMVEYHRADCVHREPGRQKQANIHMATAQKKREVANRAWPIRPGF